MVLREHDGPASDADKTQAAPGFSGRPGHARITIALEAGVDLYGTGEVPGPLRRNGARTVCWNTDRPGYTLDDESLYQSHPWVFAVRRDGSAFGVLVDTARRCAIDLRDPDRMEFRIDGPAPTVYVIEGASPQDVCRGLAKLTGAPPMPPLWALGYHQCRWSYESAGRVLEVAREFRERRIPCDAIWMDIDYMDGFRCFTFDPERFPDPRSLSESLHASGFQGVWMIDPGIKVDGDYAVYRSGQAQGVWVRDAQGKPYVGEVWPGECVFPDFTADRTRKWWRGLHEAFLEAGVDGIWNDMNEPSVFHRPGKTMPLDNQHDADEELGGPGPHERYHNLYGMLMVRATREALVELRPDRRPFVLTRSSFMGGHRHAATWTGDNASDWDHLAWSIPMTLNMGLSGQPFVGPDIGGFNGEATPELFARWMGIGALLPFARGHTVRDSADHEPWAFGPACERACRLALERRYRLLPYLYTLFYEAHVHGLPVARPAFFAGPTDPRLRDVDDAFLLGTDVYVRRRVRKDEGRSPSPLPSAAWRPFDLIEERDQALPELFLRPGAVLPVGPLVQHTGEYTLDPLTLVVNPDDDGSAEGLLYEDEGDGVGFERGEFGLTRFRAQRSRSGIEIGSEIIGGDRAGQSRQVIVRALE